MCKVPKGKGGINLHGNIIVTIDRRGFFNKGADQFKISINANIISVIEISV